MGFSFWREIITSLTEMAFDPIEVTSNSDSEMLPFLSCTAFKNVYPSALSPDQGFISYNDFYL